MKKILILLIFINYIKAEEITSVLIQKNLSLKEQSIQKSSDVLENSWINPIILSISQSKNKNSSVYGKEDFFDIRFRLSQDIFRSGGIFHAIKYANHSRNLGLSLVKSERNLKNIQAYSLLFELLKNDILQKTQNLYIQNSNLIIKRKQEQYLAGLLDISFLNDSILSKINQENALLELQRQKEKLNLEFKKLSDKDYTTINLPNIKIPTKEQFISKNLILNSHQNQIQTKNYLAKLTKSQYLPKISLNFDYTTNELKTRKLNQKDDYYSYGLSLSMPLDIRVFDDIEHSRLEYLIAQNELSILKNEQMGLYEKIINELKNIDQKLKLTKQNIQIYQTLLNQTKELVKANLKIQDDQDIMQNSLKIRMQELEILNLEKEAKKLEFYENYQL